MKIIALGEGKLFSLMVDSLITDGEEVVVCGSYDGYCKVAKNLSIQEVDLADSNNLKTIDFSMADGVLIAFQTAAKTEKFLKALQRLGESLPPITLCTDKLSLRLKRKFPLMQVVNTEEVFSPPAVMVRNHIRITGRLVRLLETVEPDDKLCIVIYGHPDPDAIGSAFALRALFNRNKRTAVIAYSDKVTRLQNQNLLHALNLEIVPLRSLDIKNFNKFALVDAQPDFFFPPTGIKFDIVIDHHPIVTAQNYLRFKDIRPEFGSTCTIMLEYLIAAGVPISKKLATAMYYGLKTDTANLERARNDADFETFKYLFRKADIGLIQRIDFSQYPKRALKHMKTVMNRLRSPQEGVWMSFAGRMRNQPDALVIMADFLIRMQHAELFIAGGMTTKSLVAVFRSNGAKHAGKIAEKAFSDVGSAGGHRTMARAEIPISELKLKIPELSDTAIERFFYERILSTLELVETKG